MSKDLIIRQVRVAGSIEMLELTSPYDPEMVKVAHELAGRWNNAVKKWFFTTDRFRQLEAECARIYGYQPKLSTGPDQSTTINTALESAHEYVSAIRALAPELSDSEREEVLVSLLTALNQ